MMWYIYKVQFYAFFKLKNKFVKNIKVMANVYSM